MKAGQEWDKRQLLFLQTGVMQSHAESRRVMQSHSHAESCDGMQ